MDFLGPFIAKYTQASIEPLHALGIDPTAYIWND